MYLTVVSEQAHDTQRVGTAPAQPEVKTTACSVCSTPYSTHTQVCSTCDSPLLKRLQKEEKLPNKRPPKAATKAN